LKIVIAGAGEVGYHLIENLCRENLDLHIIDHDVDVLDKINQEFEVQTDFANIINSDYLKEDHQNDTDLFLAITNSDQTNMIACKMAKEAGAKNTICRIRRVDFTGPKSQRTLESLGIDWAINPVSIVAEELYHLIYDPNIVDSHVFANGELLLLGYKIKKNNKIVGEKISALLEIFQFESMRLAIHKRREICSLPNPDHVIEPEDVLFCFCKIVDQPQLKKLLGFKEKTVQTNRIFINGGGQIGVKLAKLFEDSYQDIKIIEKSYERCLKISEELQRALVLNFDGTDQKQLIAEGIEEADYFFAVTDSEEINLTSCMVTASVSNAKTVCMVQQPELTTIINQKTPVHIGISPRVLTARHLAKFIQGKNVFGYFSFSNSKLEVLEIHLDENATCVNKTIGDLRLPDGTSVPFIQRRGGFITPGNNERLQAGDYLILILHLLDRKSVLSIFK